MDVPTHIGLVGKLTQVNGPMIKVTSFT
ncbi:hypothetical protein SAMN05216227_10881, partial [Pseudorhodobacter antarcticus]